MTNKEKLEILEKVHKRTLRNYEENSTRKDNQLADRLIEEI